MTKKRKPGRPKSVQPLTLFAASVERRHAKQFHETRKKRKTTARKIFAEMIASTKPNDT